MTHLVVLWLALFAAQATTPAAPPSSQQPSAQPAQPHALIIPSPNQAAPAEPPNPNPDASGIYHVGGGVTEPKIISVPQPMFSELARKQKIGGIATVSFIIDEQGNTQNVHISRSIADMVDRTHREAALSLDQAAVDVVKKYKFKPATKDGKPVAVYSNAQVNFQLY